MKKSNREILEQMIHEFSPTSRFEDMVKNYKWFSLASSIKNEELTLKLMKEIIKEGTHVDIHQRLNTRSF